MIERRKTSQQQGYWDFIKFILQAGCIVSLIHAFAFKPFHIPSGSMIPSLLVKDYL